jgi:hypothetical protein
MQEEALENKILKLAEIMKKENTALHTSTYDGLDSYRENMLHFSNAQQKKADLTFSNEIYFFNKTQLINILMFVNIKTS